MINSQTQEEFQKTTTNRLDKIEETLEAIVSEQKRSNLIVEIYQKSSQQLVNLAFGLLVPAALAIIIPALAK